MPPAAPYIPWELGDLAPSVQAYIDDVGADAFAAAVVYADDNFVPLSGGNMTGTLNQLRASNATAELNRAYFAMKDEFGVVRWQVNGRGAMEAGNGPVSAAGANFFVGRTDTTDGLFPGMQQEVFHNTGALCPVMHGMRGKGTWAAKADIAANDIMMRMAAWGYAGGAFRWVANIDCAAVAAPSGVLLESRWEFHCSSPSGAKAERMRLEYNRLTIPLPNSAPVDANIWNSGMTFWLDETTDILTFRIRRSNGDIITKTL